MDELEEGLRRTAGRATSLRARCEAALAAHQDELADSGPLLDPRQGASGGDHSGVGGGGGALQDHLRWCDSNHRRSPPRPLSSARRPPSSSPPHSKMGVEWTVPLVEDGSTGTGTGNGWPPHPSSPAGWARGPEALRRRMDGGRFPATTSTTALDSSSTALSSAQSIESTRAANEARIVAQYRRHRGGQEHLQEQQPTGGGDDLRHLREEWLWRSMQWSPAASATTGASGAHYMAAGQTTTEGADEEEDEREQGEAYEAGGGAGGGDDDDDDDDDDDPVVSATRIRVSVHPRRSRGSSGGDGNDAAALDPHQLVAVAPPSLGSWSELASGSHSAWQHADGSSECEEEGSSPEKQPGAAPEKGAGPSESQAREEASGARWRAHLRRAVQDQRRHLSGRRRARECKAIGETPPGQEEARGARRRSGPIIVVGCGRGSGGVGGVGGASGDGDRAYGIRAAGARGPGLDQDGHERGVGCDDDGQEGTTCRG
jgi:hypothetical protein